MVDTFLVGLDVAVEHRAVGRDAQAMRRVVRQEPEVRMLLAGRNEPAHAICEHLGAAARQRAEPDIAERAKHLLV